MFDPYQILTSQTPLGDKMIAPVGLQWRFIVC